MKNSKFWQMLAVTAVVGLFLNAAGLWRAQGGSVPALPVMDMFTGAAYGQTPLVEKFDEQGQNFLRVWNTDDKGTLHYRVLRWQLGSLQSKMVPELVQHISFDTAGKMTILVQKS